MYKYGQVALLLERNRVVSLMLIRLNREYRASNCTDKITNGCSYPVYMTSNFVTEIQTQILIYPILGILLQRALHNMCM